MPGASSALISAALSGLLLLGASACSSKEDNAANGGRGGRSGAGGASGSAGQASAGTGGVSGSAGSGGPDGAPDAGADVSGDGGGMDDAGSEDAGSQDESSDGGGSDDALDSGFPDGCVNPTGIIDGSVTSAVHDPDMTLEKFVVLCNQRGGVVELICHCGGANSCKGISYDTTIGMLSEHTCMGLNTCAGYSCVIP